MITSFLKKNPSYHISELSLIEYQLKQSKSKLIINKRKHSFGNVSSVLQDLFGGHSSLVSLLVNVKHNEKEINEKF